MISGQKAFGGMSTTLARERAALDSFESQLRQVRAQLEALQREDLADLRALAELRLDDVAAGEIGGRLSRAESQAMELLEQRDGAVQGLDKDIDLAGTQLDAMRADEDLAAETVEGIESKLETEEAALLSKLEKDAAYQELAEAARLADIQAANAAEKAENSDTERQTKGQAYEDSQLFMYLWERKFGTSDYSAFPLIRYLDGRVANMIRYHDARLNYQRLTELPIRLADHAQQLSADSDTADTALNAYWTKARSTGGLDKLDDQLTKAEKTLAAASAKVEAADTRLQALRDERHALLGQGDEWSAKAIDVLASALGRKDIADLWDQARDTLSRDDDRIVNGMIAREEERDRLEDMIEKLERTYSRRNGRLNDFGGLLGEFKRKYSNPASGFLSGALIAELAEEFLEGILDEDDWWEELGKQHRKRRKSPTTRSGPWGHKSRKKQRWPSKSKSSSGRSSKSHRSSGGFRTGGRSRSSGGFRTGGGI